MLAFIFSATGSQSTKWMLEIWHFLDRIKIYFLGGCTIIPLCFCWISRRKTDGIDVRIDLKTDYPYIHPYIKTVKNYNKIKFLSAFLFSKISSIINFEHQYWNMK